MGGSAGFGTGDVANKFTLTHVEANFSESATSKFEDDIKGAIYGAHIGYNWQFGHIIAGLEAAVNGSDIKGSTDILGGEETIKTELNWYATAVARLGYAEGNWLFYGFGGIAWGNVDTKLFDGAAFGGELIGSGGTDHMGWTAGLGIEHAFNDHFAIRVEYWHVALGEKSASLGTLTNNGGFTSFDNSVDLEFDAIKIGASYKLFSGDRDIEPLK